MKDVVVAVIGANGQVGSEVCLLLSVMPGVRVIPIVRSEYGASFLRRCGLPCRVGAASDPGRARELLEGADVVADFSLPGGLPSQIKPAIRANVNAVTKAAPPGAPYVFISSTMAFGMGREEPSYRDRHVARTVYAAQKRYGERLARGLGLLRRRDVFVLRLGQVHGDLQAVSHGMMSAAGGLPLVLPRGGDVPSDVVFCGTIAVALVHIARKMAPPGTYALLDAPEWTLRQLYELYAAQTGTSVEIRAGGGPAARRSLARQWLAQATGAVVKYKEVLTAQVLPSWNAIEERFRGPYLARRTAADIAAGQASSTIAPQHFLGPVPGRRMPTLHDAAGESAEAVSRVRALLDERLGPRSHCFPLVAGPSAARPPR